mgnify:CR=1 FL=1
MTMKMKQIMSCLFLLFLALAGRAQTFRYLSVEEGLSSRRVFAIQKDSKGYM